MELLSCANDLPPGAPSFAAVSLHQAPSEEPRQQCGALGILSGCSVSAIPWTTAAAPGSWPCPQQLVPTACSPQGKESSRTSEQKSFVHSRHLVNVS